MKIPKLYIAVISVGIMLCCCTKKLEAPIEINIIHSSRSNNTSISVCASIINNSDDTVSIFPPEYGANIFAAQYGVKSGNDTIWFSAATDMDLDTYPEIRIPAKMKYTYNFSPNYFGLWHDRKNAKIDSGYMKALNSADKIAIRYATGINDSIPKNADHFDSVMSKKYNKYKLQSKFSQIQPQHFGCDSGISQ